MKMEDGRFSAVQELEQEIGEKMEKVTVSKEREREKDGNGNETNKGTRLSFSLSPLFQQFLDLFNSLIQSHSPLPALLSPFAFCFPPFPFFSSQFAFPTNTCLILFDTYTLFVSSTTYISVSRNCDNKLSDFIRVNINVNRAVSMSHDSHD